MVEGRGERPANASTSPVFIGRDPELEAVRRALSAPPAVVAVEGEPGVGKTRLVTEAIRDPAFGHHRRLVGYCPPLREPFPLGPVVEAIRADEYAVPKGLSPLVGALRPLFPEIGERLPPELPPLSEPRAERHRAFRALRELLVAFGPTVLVLEDLHWADEATIELLAFLGARIPPELSLVLTYRHEELDPLSSLFELVCRPPAGTRVVRIPLHPLSWKEVGQLVCALLGTKSVSDEFAIYLHERTSGLPFAVEEVLRLLREREDVVVEGGRWTRRALDQLEVPAAIRDSIAKRIERISEDGRRVVRASAVLASPAEQALLARVADLPEERAGGGIAEALGLVILDEDAEGRFAFRHALARQATLEAILGPERRKLHLRAARILERVEPSPARIAHHYREAGRTGPWREWAERAADVASSRGDHTEAARQLRAVLLSEGLDRADQARIARKLGDAALHGLAHAKSIELVRRTIDEVPMPDVIRGELRFSLGRMLMQAGHAAEGFGEIERAVPELRDRPLLAARAMSSLAYPFLRHGHLRQHLLWLDRALQAARASPDPVVSTILAVDRATVYSAIGDVRTWEALAEIPHDAPTVEQRQHLVRARLNVAWSAMFLGYHGRAHALLAEGRRLAKRFGYTRWDLALDTSALLLDWFAGRWDGLSARAEELVAATEDFPVAGLDAQLVLAMLSLATGQPAAEARLAGLHDLGLETGFLPGMTTASGGIAWLRLSRGDATGAANQTAAALDVIRHKGIWTWATNLAPAAVAAAAAAALDPSSIVDEFRRGLVDRDSPAGTAALAECRAISLDAEGEAARAVSLWRRAERAWSQISRPHDAARASEGLGRVLAKSGHPEGAQRLRAALEAFRDLGATWDAARVRRTMREHGVPVVSRRGRRGYGDRLSPREEEVARLAAEGRTNREIAEILFLSPRTVEEHVAKALRKLRIGSRRDLAERLRPAVAELIP